MSDTASLVESAVAEATAVADTEPIAGDDTPDTSAASGDTPPAATDSEPPTDGSQAPPSVVAEAPKKKRGPIPYDRHEAVLTKARNEAAKVQQELQARIEALSKFESEEVQTRLKLMDLLESDPARAVAVLKQVDPERFAHMAWAAEQAAEAAAATSAQPAAAAPGEKPQPDALLPDGTLGYSAEGALKLVEWRLAQERPKFEQEIATLRKELSPITDEHEARVEFDKSVLRMRPVLEQARQNWDGFKEHEQEIREQLVKNQTWSLDDAYRAVVLPKLKSNREAIRAEERKRILDEMNAKGKATGVLPGHVPAAAASGTDTTRTTADLVREAVQRAAA